LAELLAEEFGDFADELELEFGATFDSMSEIEKRQLAESSLDQAMLKHFHKSPESRLHREFLLMGFEKPNGIALTV
jgi:hypothetical protein